jgi:molybdopterin synthase catalytic subunit
VVAGGVDAEEVRRAVVADASGAVVLFFGTVRDRTGNRPVRALEYEAYPGMAEAQMERIAEEVRERHGLTAIACIHRTGRLEIGDVAVVVGTSSPHRRAALEAVDDFVTRLKQDVPIWKKEHFEDGATWVGSPNAPQGKGGG